jgi:cytochrome c553
MTHPSRIVFILSLPVAFILGGCGQGGDEATARRSAPSAAVLEDMHQHVPQVRELEEAVIRGDLDAVRAPAAWLADHHAPSGLPHAGDRYMEDMRAAARRAADAKDIQTAAYAMASMAAACGNCHRELGTPANLPSIVVPAAATDRAGHMREHQAAVDLMYRGLAAPSDENWKKGAEMLAAVPLTDKELGEEGENAAAAEARVHELAKLAIAADGSTRIQVFGNLVSTCAGCHSLHGRVLGPGLPKTTE